MIRTEYNVRTGHGIINYNPERLLLLLEPISESTGTKPSTRSGRNRARRGGAGMVGGGKCPFSLLLIKCFTSPYFNQSIPLFPHLGPSSSPYSQHFHLAFFSHLPPFLHHFSLLSTLFLPTHNLIV